MEIEIVFETHSTSEDNERGVASGWAHSRLSKVGREQAKALRERREDDGIDAVFSSDLRRAAETAEVAFGDTPVPILLDWRLRECDYGDETQGPADWHRAHRCDHVTVPYPNGESWQDAADRVGWFLNDLATRWTSVRVLVIGHVATRWGLEHYISGVPLERLCTAGFEWREGWEFTLG